MQNLNSLHTPHSLRGPSLLLLSVVALIFTACQKKLTEVSYRSTQESMLLLASDKSDQSSGATIAIPKEFADLSGKLQIEEGATIAGEATAAALNIGESGLNQAGPSINVSAKSEVDYAQIGRLEISIPVSDTAGLALQDSSFLVVIYQVQDADGKILIGLIPASGFKFSNSMATFKMLGFGNYQAVRVKVEVKEEIKVKTEETKVLTKTEQQVLPEMSVAAISPIIAFKGQKVTVTGSNFRPGIKLAYLGRQLSQVEVKSDTALSVVIDEAPRRGRGNLYLAQDGVERSLALAYAGSSSDFPLMTVAASEVCSGQKFYNANGELLEGTKTCTVATSSTPSPTYPNCSSDGQTGCLTTNAFKAASMTAVQAASIASGTTIAGVAGSAVVESHSNCSAANQTGCIATATYKTMDLSSASSGVPDLSVGTFNTRIADPTAFEFWDSSGARHSLSGDSDLTAANVKLGVNIFSVSGSYSGGGAPANCASDGESGCVVDGSSFGAAALSGLAAKVLSGQSVAGVPGNVTLPAASNVLTGSGSFGPSGAAITPSYSPDFPSVANVRTGDTVDGMTGTLGDCSTDGAIGCVAVASFRAAAASILQAENIRSGVTLGGVSGDYPSASSPLNTSTATTDLNSGNFMSLLQSPSSFEFFDSSGTRYTATGDSDFVPMNFKASVSLNFTGSFLTGSFTPSLNCPSNYVKVLGDSQYGLPDFCVMKYEAKNISGVASSQASNTPWSLNQAGAITACRALGTGYDLISNPQWMALAGSAAALASNWSGGAVGSGTLYSGHNDGSPAMSCAASSDDSLYFVESSCTAMGTGDSNDQKRIFNLSNGQVIWDLAGNMAESVNYVNISDKPNTGNSLLDFSALTETLTSPKNIFVPTNALKAFWNDSWTFSQGIGKYNPGSNGTGGALVRGGKFNDYTAAGAFSADLTMSPNGTAPTYLGFRCMKFPEL